MRFSTFIDSKISKTREELEILKNVFNKANIKVEDFIKDHEPYLFIPCLEENLDFGGIRIYKVGSNMAYRIQSESASEPYGGSYALNIEQMFEDLIAEMDEEKAAEKINQAIVEEIQGFFKKSLEAQEELASSEYDPHNKIIFPRRIGDLSNSM